MYSLGDILLLMNEYFINNLQQYSDPLPEAFAQTIHIISEEDENGDCEEMYIYIKRTKLLKKNNAPDNRKKSLVDNLGYKKGQEETVVEFMKKFFKGILSVTKL
jgi:hypothetical protein